MLTIMKLRDAEYLWRQIARGIEEYYTSYIQTFLTDRSGPVGPEECSNAERRSATAALRSHED